MKKFTLATLVALATSSFGQGWTGDVGTIGPSATTLTFQQGLGSLAIQANSVGSNVPIFFGPNLLCPKVPTLLAGSEFSIGRPMLTLSKPATLVLNYSTRSLPVGTVETALRVYNLVNHKWTLVGGTVNTVNKTVTTTITRAGTYALLASTGNALNAENLLVQVFGNVSQPQNEWFSVDTLDLTSDSNIFPIGRSIERKFEAAISPAYNAIFTTRREPTGTYSVYSTNADGSHPVRLTSVSAQAITNVAISGDGRFVCFSAYVGGSFSVYKMNADGTSISTIATGLAGNGEGVPIALNAAGTQLSIGIGNTVRVVTTATGVTVRTVTIAAGATKIKGLSYNAAGLILAVTTDTGLYTVTASSGAAALREASTDFGSQVVWSPDGTKIAVKYINQIDVLKLSPKTWYDAVFPATPGEFWLYWR